MSEKIILGNIITMDDSMLHAEAAAIKDGIIVKVGTEAEARAAVSESAEVLDYKGQWIYPGFLEAHSHGMFAGYRAIGQADLSKVLPTNYDTYREIIKQFIIDNPDNEFSLAAGWLEDTTPIDHKYLDDICSDKPLIMNTGGGHSCLLNTKAMEVFGINDASVEKYGTALVHVGPDGHPDGYICEEPCIKLLGGLPQTVADIKDYLLNWQDTALSHGITAVADCGVELMSPLTLQAYKELEEEGKLCMRTYAYLLSPDHPENPTAEVERIAKIAEESNGEYIKVVGVKAFLSKFIIDSKLHRLKPSVIVDYARLAFVYPYSDVRITFDSLIKSGKKDDFINRNIVKVDCLESDQIVLEVKYNEILPDHIQTILNQYNLALGSVSKFALCDEFK